LVQRVVAELRVTHPSVGDLVGNLSHLDQFAVLNNHSRFSGSDEITYQVTYDDSNGGLFFGSRTTDGPGTLNNFVGTESRGLWLFTMSDDSLNWTGRVENLTLRVQPQLVLGGGSVLGSVLANQFVYYFVDVPVDATRLTVTLSSLDPALPLNLYLRRGQAPTTTEYDKAALINPPGGSLSLGLYDVPPLNAGRYFIGIFNPNAVTVSFRIRLDLERDLAAINGAGLLGGDTPLPLQDEAITRSSVYVATAQPVVDVQVGVRVQHARASDLLLYLVSPQGTRVLLAENRGRTNALGIGGNTDVVTNYTSVFSNSFERAVDGYYLEGETFDGWQVETNLASVLNDATLAHTGNKVLALRTARIARVLPTMAGRDYQLDYCYRLNPGRGCIISWWPGEEDAADRTGNNPGALENGLGFAPGWVGRAFSFDGTNDACRVPASTSLHVQSFTLEGWLQPADLSRPQPIGAYAATNDWLGLHCGINADATGTNVSPGALYVNVRAAGANPPAADHVLATRPGLLTTNAWYHVAWTFDQPSGLAQIYLNGTLAAATNLGSFSPRTGLPLYLGHRPPGSLDPDGGATYRGLLDEFSLYDCVLSAVEIEDVVLSGSGGKCANSRPAVTCSSTNVAVLGGSLTNLAIGELPWKTNSVQFRAPQDGTRLSLETDGYQPGMLLDTLQLFELETVSNPNFTTFTESTNLATFPIKFAPAPFTNSLVSTVQTNRLLLDDSFELYSTGSYPAGTNLAGWRVTSGEVVVHGHTNALSILPVSGSNFVELKVQADPAAFSTNVQTVANRQYRLTFLAHRNPTGPAGSPQAVALYTNGVISEWIDVPVSAWVTNTVTYRAASTSLELEFRSAGSTGPLLDLVQLLELADDRQYYFLPEETLQAFEGESPLGNWTLEVWDDRGGPDSSLEPALAAWQLNFIFAHTNPPATPLVFCRPDTNTASVYLQDCIPATNTVANDEIQYFYVEVPRSATLALNHLRSVDGTNDLVLLFSQNGLPTGRRASDVVVDQSTGPEEFLLLNTNDPPQLQPGQRYYLGVANAHPDETSHFLLSVTFDRRDTNLLSLLALTNGVPYTATIPVTNALQYYQFTVSSNATEVRFELFPQDGNVDLVVRKALAIPDPLPTTSPGRYDYISQNGGTNAELIAVTAASQPFALEPGVWYLGVFNVHTNPVTYAIRATELSGSPIQIVPLTDGVPLAGSLVVGSATTNYYLFSVNQSPGAALFELYDVTQPADLLLNLSAFPTPAVFFARDPAAPTRPGQIVLRTNVLFPSLNGDWYLAVGNPLTVDLTYTIRAALPTNGLLLSGQPLQVQAATLGGGGLELTWNTVEGEKYEVDSSTNLVTWLTITNFVATGKTLTFIDPSAGQLPALYYRVRQVP
jgi:subtilisin-like proprotein convertase family protein